MGKFSTQDKVCILLFCGLMWTFGDAEQLFFRLPSSATWDEARSHCQACFKDLVTLTPDNIQIIVRNLSSDYWVGLRKNFTSTGNSSVFWSRWANGDPLTFQNWLPGQPVFKSRLPKTHCCSCACTCPAKPPSESFTTRYTTPTPTYSNSTNPASVSFTRTYTTPAQTDSYSSDQTSGDFTTSYTTPAQTDRHLLRQTSENFNTSYTTPVQTNSHSSNQTSGDFTRTYTTPVQTDSHSSNQTSGDFTTSYTTPTPTYNHSTNPASVSFTRTYTTPAQTDRHLLRQTSENFTTSYTTPAQTDSYSSNQTSENFTTSYTTPAQTDSYSSNQTSENFTTSYTTPAQTDSLSSNQTSGDFNTSYTTPAQADSSRVTNSRRSGTDSSGLTDVTSQNFARNTGSTREHPASTAGHNVTAQTHTTPVTTTVPPVAAECVRTPVEWPEDDFGSDDNYIEDACVVMLSFGAWVEKNCSELLPYICYDDVFNGDARVTNITATSAYITWEEGPGDITHYRLEVIAGKRQTGQRPSPNTVAMAANVTANLTTTNLSHHLYNLTAGSHYSVQVFAVKCGRDLNPQETIFYTIPHSVKNLNVTHVMDTSIGLSWEKPDGSVDIYRVTSPSLTKPLVVETEKAEISNLEPGLPYNFSVFSGVKDESKWSDKVDISTHTKPQKVSNLRVSGANDNSMMLKWDLLAGSASGFLIMVFWNDKLNRSFSVGENVREHKVEHLPSGTEVTLCVRTLADNDKLQGEEAKVVNHTAPQRTSNVTLKTTATTLTATWEIPGGYDYRFEVELWLGNERVDTKKTSNTSQYFDKLKTAANYSVRVYSVSGDQRSRARKAWKFTLPEKPVNVTAKNPTKNQITFEWSPPENAGTSEYHIRLTSVFWGQSWNHSVAEKTTFTFKNLISGTNYSFEVRAKAGNLESEAVCVSQSTVTDPGEVILSVMCSSETPLLCGEDATRTYVFNRLESHFRNKLGDSVFWKLAKFDRPKKKT